MQVDTFFNRVDDPASIFAADPDVLVLGIVPQDEAFGWEFLASNLVQLIVGLMILEPMLVGAGTRGDGEGAHSRHTPVGQVPLAFKNDTYKYK